MGFKDPLQMEEEIQVNFSEIEKQSKDWHDKGFKIMVVYQPITGGSVATPFYGSMLSALSGEIWYYMLEKHNIIIKPYVCPHFPIDANRNMAVADARERYGADFIMFMDTDQTFPAKTIPMLYEELLRRQAQNPICVSAGMYFVKKNPWRAVFGDYGAWDKNSEPFREQLAQMGLVDADGNQLLWWRPVDFWEPNSVFQVDVIGAGCMMMPTSVFDAIEAPFFKYMPDLKNPGKQVSEDMWFCAQLKKAGIPIWMNSNVSCGHLSAYEVNEVLFSNQRDTLFENMEKGKAQEVYSKLNDRRSAASISKFKGEVLGLDLGDE